MKNISVNFAVHLCTTAAAVIAHFLNTAGQYSPVPDSEEIKKDRAVIA